MNSMRIKIEYMRYMGMDMNGLKLTGYHRFWWYTVPRFRHTHMFESIQDAWQPQSAPICHLGPKASPLRFTGGMTGTEPLGPYSFSEAGTAVVVIERIANMSMCSHLNVISAVYTPCSWTKRCESKQRSRTIW